MARHARSGGCAKTGSSTGLFGEDGKASLRRGEGKKGAFSRKNVNLEVSRQAAKPPLLLYFYPKSGYEKPILSLNARAASNRTAETDRRGPRELIVPPCIKNKPAARGENSIGRAESPASPSARSRGTIASLRVRVGHQLFLPSDEATIPASAPQTMIVTTPSLKRTMPMNAAMARTAANQFMRLPSGWST